MTLNDMFVEMWPTEKPVEYVRNARKIPAAAVDKVAASIQEFGRPHFHEHVVQRHWIVSLSLGAISNSICADSSRFCRGRDRMAQRSSSSGSTFSVDSRARLTGESPN